MCFCRSGEGYLFEFPVPRRKHLPQQYALKRVAGFYLRHAKGADFMQPAMIRADCRTAERKTGAVLAIASRPAPGRLAKRSRQVHHYGYSALTRRAW